MRKMMKFFINGKEVEVPRELNSLFEGILSQNKFPFGSFPNLVQPRPPVIPQSKEPTCEEIFMDVEFDLEECKRHSLSHKARVPRALLNLHERITYLENILIKKQLEEEKRKIKPIVKKKISITKPKKEIKKSITAKPIQKKRVLKKTAKIKTKKKK